MGDTPYNLRNCAYLDDFSQPKIVWARLMRLTKSDIDNFPRFSVVDSEIFTVDSLCFFTGENLHNLCMCLNSTYAAYYFFRNIAILDNGGLQMRQQYVEDIPLPPTLCNSEQEIFDAFGFTSAEVSFIKTFIDQKKNEIMNR
jgi:hypothetical protein